jgi:hypothetical protein
VNTGGSSAEAYLNAVSSSLGLRLQWVQNVNIPVPLLASALSQRFQLAASYSTSQDSVQLASGILPAQTNIIQASTDLVHWIPIFTNIGSYTNFGTSLITDSSTSNYLYRFYRAVPWP